MWVSQKDKPFWMRWAAFLPPFMPELEASACQGRKRRLEYTL